MCENVPIMTTIVKKKRQKIVRITEAKSHVLMNCGSKYHAPYEIVVADITVIISEIAEIRKKYQ